MLPFLLYTSSNIIIDIIIQNDVIVLAPENIQKQTVTSEVAERMKTGKKRAKKLRKKMSGRTRENETMLQSMIERGTSDKPSRHSQRQ